MDINKLPDPFNGFGRAFEMWWSRAHPQGTPAGKQEALCQKLELIYEFIELAQGLILEPPHVVCAVETRQNYRDFSGPELVQVLRGLGLMARMLYNCERDVLIGNHVLDPDPRYPLQVYYIEALEWVVNMVATFTQEPDRCRFVDLTTRLTEILEGRAGESR